MKQPPPKPGALPQSLVAPASAHPVLDQETQAFLDIFAESEGLPLHLMTPEQSRARMADLQVYEHDSLPVEIEELTVECGGGGEVVLRILRKPGLSGSLPVVVYLHGGGWMMGDRDSHDRLVRELAVRTEAAVVFVEYTMAMGTRFPVQNEQAYCALCYLVKHAEALRLDGRRMAVAGDGAGGNMAAVLALLSKRRRGPAIVFQMLLYPVMSIPDSTPSYKKFAYGPWLTAEAMRHYIGTQFAPESLGNVEALPGNASVDHLQGLPAALIITAENDVLRDEAEAYARKLVQAGVTVTAARYLGCIHDFMLLNRLADTPAARAAMTQACEALSAALRA